MVNVNTITILSLLTQEQHISVHSFSSSIISLSCCMSLSVYRPWSCLKFIPKYDIIYAVINSISISNSYFHSSIEKYNQFLCCVL